MPRTPIDYSKTVIYKLVHKDDTDNKNVYVGSTTDFIKRKYHHKSACKDYTTPKYQFIRDNGGWDEWQMIEIEKYPCNDKREAEARERYWIEYYKASLNKILPTRSTTEWCKDNKEHIKQYRKEYDENNKEYIKQRKREWYEANKEHIIQKNKTLYQQNCEIKKTYQREYRQNDPYYQEKHNQYLKEHRRLKKVLPLFYDIQ